MFVLGIDETTTHKVFLHIDQIQLDDTCHIAIVLMLFRTVLCGQLQEHTRCQSHLIETSSLVAVTAGRISSLIRIVRLVNF